MHRRLAQLTPDPVRHARVVQLLLLCGILLPLADLTIIAVFAAQHPDYSHVRHFMSELGEEGRPFGSLVNAWFTLSSLLLVGFGVAMAALLPRGGAAAGCVLLFLISSGLGVVGGFFPCDLGCRGATFSGWLHLLIGEIGAACMLPVPTMFWLAIRNDRRWRGIGWFTAMIQPLVMILSGVLLGAAYEAYVADQSLRELAGLFQRLYWAVYYIWIAVVGVGLLRSGPIVSSPLTP